MCFERRIHGLVLTKCTYLWAIISPTPTTTTTTTTVPWSLGFRNDISLHLRTNDISHNKVNCVPNKPPQGVEKGFGIYLASTKSETNSRHSFFSLFRREGWIIQSSRNCPGSECTSCPVEDSSGKELSNLGFCRAINIHSKTEARFPLIVKCVQTGRFEMDWPLSREGYFPWINLWSIDVGGQTADCFQSLRLMPNQARAIDVWMRLVVLPVFPRAKLFDPGRREDGRFLASKICLLLQSRPQPRFVVGHYVVDDFRTWHGFQFKSILNYRSEMVREVLWEGHQIRKKSCITSWLIGWVQFLKVFKSHIGTQL